MARDHFYCQWTILETEWKQDYYRDFLFYYKQFKYQDNLYSFLIIKKTSEKSSA